ncbi:MAG: hypothetical protein ACOYM3_34435, partial [Terrimicrobiaceae bacterium]
MKTILLALALPTTLLAGLPPPPVAATYTVLNLDDSGPGSLRQAVQSANLIKGSTIAFATNGTIKLSTPLPNISKQVTIDGTTAPGYSGSPVVSVDFNGRPGLSFTPGAEGSALKSLSLVKAGSAAVTIQASKISVQGNYIG